MPKVMLPDWVREEDSLHPLLGGDLGPYATRLLSDPGGLTQFGAFLEELPPGSTSGRRHWHETEDEMVLILSGSVVLVEERETPLHPGDVACWPAGHPVGHRLDNRSNQPARYLVIGMRNPRDVIHYTDQDLVTHKDGTARRYLRRDGSVLGTFDASQAPASAPQPNSAGSGPTPPTPTPERRTE